MHRYESRISRAVDRAESGSGRERARMQRSTRGESAARAAGRSGSAAWPMERSEHVAICVCVCVAVWATVTSAHRVMGSEYGPKAYVYVVFSSSLSLVSGHAAEILNSKFRHFVTAEMSGVG